jgi:vWA-MoxR associated protein C-terminal domain/vWA-MoxR associated protein middle region 0
VRLGSPGSSGDDPDRARRQAIAEALRTVDLLRDPKGREMCIEFSEEEIGERILQTQTDAADTTDDDADLLELTNQLLSRDVAIWVFIYALTDICGNEITESLIAAVSQHVARPLLSRKQRSDLHQICDDLDVFDIEQLFASSIDPVRRPMRSDSGNLHAVLNELEEFPARAEDGLYPIAIFVYKLASALPPEAGDLLRTWVEALVGHQTPQLAALRKIGDSQGTANDPEPRYCLIKIDPDGVDVDRFCLSISLQEGSRPPEPLPREDDASYSEEQICGLIYDALTSRQLTGVEPDQLRIEFLLPTSLINLPIDQWRVGATFLGMQCQVVVRSLTRILDLAGIYRYYWHEKWPKVRAAELFSAAGVPDVEFRGTDETTWLTEEAAERDHALIYASLIDQGGPVCLVLADAPTPDHGQALWLALTAGVPVLAWSRHPEIDLGGGLSELLADAAPLRLADLPGQVLRFRRGAAGRGADHLASSLTLLYDDPDRIPDLGSLLQTPA